MEPKSDINKRYEIEARNKNKYLDFNCLKSCPVVRYLIFVR